MRQELQERLRRLEPYLPLSMDYKDLLDIAQAQTGKDRDTLRDMYGNFSYGQWARVINFC